MELQSRTPPPYLKTRGDHGEQRLCFAFMDPPSRSEMRYVKQGSLRELLDLEALRTVMVDATFGRVVVCEVRQFEDQPEEVDVRCMVSGYPSAELREQAMQAFQREIWRQLRL